MLEPNPEMSSFLSHLSSQVDKLRSSRNDSRPNLVQNLLNSVANLSEQTRSHCVAPPPLDYLSDLSNSVISVNDSDCSDDFKEIVGLENLPQVQDCNKELKNAVKETIRHFQMASNELLNGSFVQSNQASVILNELENVKQVLSDMVEESRIGKNGKSDASEVLEENGEVKALQELYRQIEEIQKEIQDAKEKLVESEEMIERTDRENNDLRFQLHLVESSVNNILEIEEGDKKASCKCEII
jgi:hypothetical protein